MNWEQYWGSVTGPVSHGNERSYRLAGEFLKDCAVVEDWGCGTGMLRHYIAGRYVGVDAWSGQYADVHVDLVDYLSTVEGICIRHVLEYNSAWPVIVANALDSMTKRLVIVISDPASDVWRSRNQLCTLLHPTTYTIVELPGLGEIVALVSAEGVEHEQAMTAALIA